MSDKSEDVPWSNMQQLSIEEDESKGEAANTDQSSATGDNEEDDDIGKEFQDAVRQRGSVTVDRRKGSTRSRTQRKRSSVEEGRDGRPQSDVFSSLSKFRENQKTGSKTDSIALNAKHARILHAATERIKTQLPLSLECDIKEEAYAIVQNTAQAYNRLLGKKHRLTIEAFDYLSSM